LKIKHVILLFLVAFFIIIGLQAQTGKEKQTRKNAEKIEYFQKLFYQKARKEVIKARRKMQHKETQKKMKEADRRARRFNRKNNVLFFVKYIKRRKVKK